MADSPEESLPSAMDYAEHNGTFELFVGLIKWGTVLTVAILILMAIFLL
ncbi:MAG: hypothetical protein Rhims3KO_16900 [Hyphomicrobiales bacterium]